MRFSVFCVCGVAVMGLSACGWTLGQPPTSVPSGYAYQDRTPLSTPHDSTIDPVRDATIKDERAQNVMDWDAAAQDIVAQLRPALSARPSQISLVALDPDARTRGAFDYALRKALGREGFIVAAHTHTPTVLRYGARLASTPKALEAAQLELKTMLFDQTKKSPVKLTATKGLYRIRYQEIGTSWFHLP